MNNSKINKVIQKFPIGTFVKIKVDLGPSMVHFEKGCAARVEYTYAQAYVGGNTKTYSLLVRFDNGQWSSVSWYDEHHLTEITDPNLIAKYITEIENDAGDITIERHCK